MSRSSDALTPQCRAVLRGRSTEVAPLRDHVEECAFCSEWLSRRAGLQLLMAQPIPPAPELRSEGMFARLRERIIEDCEDGPVGQVLEQAMPVAPIADGDAWPEPLLGSDLAPQLDARSPAPGALDWGLVRAAVLEDIVDPAAGAPAVPDRARSGGRPRALRAAFPGERIQARAAGDRLRRYLVSAHWSVFPNERFAQWRDPMSPLCLQSCC